MNCKSTRKISNLCSNFDLYRGYKFFSFREVNDGTNVNNIFNIDEVPILL
jgi:hypothetical protein